MEKIKYFKQQFTISKQKKKKKKSFIISIAASNKKKTKCHTAQTYLSKQNQVSKLKTINLNLNNLLFVICNFNLIVIFCQRAFISLTSLTLVSPVIVLINGGKINLIQ